MKRNLVAGLFAVGLIAAGGTGYYLASGQDNPTSPRVMMQQNGQDNGSMIEMMNSSNVKDDQTSKDNGFKQMLPFMKKMHPNLSEEELKSFYESMHGANGAPSCGNGQGMMGNFNDDTVKETGTEL
jgi:hypothetical protein